MRAKTAREKNQLSSATEGRHASGGSDKASSEKTPLAKGGVHRAARKLTSQESPTSSVTLHVPDAKAHAAPVRAGGTGWKKQPDARLGEHLARKKIRPPRP
ncbi:MAG: hypothetical protein QOE10_961 [Gaiellales bacterium]|jgi:hypothetical protein|nr:hypothetical protein [Gaiellales bacterium]